MPASATLPQHLLHPAHKKSAGAEFSAHKPPTGPGAHARLEPGVQFSRPQSAMAQHPEGSKTAQMSLPEGMSADEYRRAYDIVASASAFHHNQALHPGNTLRRQPSRLSQAGHPRDRSSVTVEMHNKEEEDHGGHGGHDAPNWSRLKSYSVLLGCTLLYAIIAGMSSSNINRTSLKSPCRDPCRRGRCSVRGLGHSREVLGCYPFRPRS